MLLSIQKPEAFVTKCSIYLGTYFDSHSVKTHVNLHTSCSPH